MASQGRTFRRTQAGTAAVTKDDRTVPSDYRRILGVVRGDTHSDVIRGCLRQYPDYLLDEWLDEIVELGLLQAIEPESDPFDLDFTTFLSSGKKPKAELPAEDMARLEHDAQIAGATLLHRGAFIADGRLKNRPTWTKSRPQTIVFIVEDDPDQLALAGLRLKTAKYSVRVARSTRELVEEMRKDAAIDMLLLDVMLPDGNGFDILAKMRTHPKLALLPIVMLTAKDDPTDIRRGIALGADGYITKPYSKNIVVDTIRQVLKEKVNK